MLSIGLDKLLNDKVLLLFIRNAILFIVVCFALFVLYNTVIYSIYVSDGTLRSDHFRFIYDHYVAKEDTVLDRVFKDDTVYFIHTWLVIHILDGNFNYSALLSIILTCGLGLTLIISYGYSKFIPHIIAILSLYLVPFSIVTYSWPLVFVVFNYYIFFILLNAFFAWRYISNKRWKDIVIFLVVITVSVILSYRNFVGIAPIIAAGILFLITDKFRPRIKLLMAICGFLSLIALSLILKEFEMLVTVSSQIGKGINEAVFLKRLTGYEHLLTTSIIVIGLLNYIYKKNTYLLIVMISIFFVLCTIIISRDGLLWPRHFILAKALFISSLALVVLFVSQFFVSKNWSILFFTSASVAFGFYQLSEIESLRKVFNKHVSPNHVSREVLPIVSLQNTQNDFSLREIVGSNPMNNYWSVTNYWQENGYGVFDENYNSKIIRNLNLGLENYRSSSNNEVYEIQDSGCLVMDASSKPKYWYGEFSNNSKRYGMLSVNKELYYPAPVGKFNVWGALEADVENELCALGDNLKFRIVVHEP